MDFTGYRENFVCYHFLFVLLLVRDNHVIFHPNLPSITCCNIVQDQKPLKTKLINTFHPEGCTVDVPVLHSSLCHTMKNFECFPKPQMLHSIHYKPCGGQGGKFPDKLQHLIIGFCKAGGIVASLLPHTVTLLKPCELFCRGGLGLKWEALSRHRATEKKKKKAKQATPTDSRVPTTESYHLPRCLIARGFIRHVHFIAAHVKIKGEKK